LFRSRLLTVLLASVAALGLAVTAFWFGSTGTDYARAHASELVLSLAATALLTTVNLVLRWLRWNFLVRRMDVRIPTREGVRLYFATIPAIATPFYLGELIRAQLLSARFHGGRTAVALVWLIERVTDAIVLLLFFLVARGEVRWALLTLGGWIVALSLFRGSRSKRVRELARPIVLLVTLLSTAAAWTLAVVALQVALAVSQHPAPLGLAAEAMAGGTLLGGVAGIPLGTGVAGSTTLLLLEARGVPGDAAAAIVAVFRAGTSWYAVGLGLLTLVASRRQLVAFLRPRAGAGHFDEIAAGYEDQIPLHIRMRLLERKVSFMQSRLLEAGVSPGARGVDIGCGQGWYACEMAARGYRMDALDQAADQIAHARQYADERRCGVTFQAADAERLPFADKAFDFAYSINVIHHVVDPVKRERVLQEIVRVLKPGGVFFLHEINTENPLFRFYMSYFFPLMCEIDEGTERWIKPTRLPDVADARWAPHVDYFTFLPDFTPRPVLEALRGFEGWLERSPLRSWSAHYVARLTKNHDGH
jgi:2-polyprenyl-3-methyl-5-hydroxy-6-metoxy-1,4-benzoquinol methylase